MLKDMQCRLLVYKQHSMHWFKMDRFYHPLRSLTASETGANTNTLSLSTVLCLSGNKNVWDLWGVNLLVWEGGGGGLSNTHEFWRFLSLYRHCQMTSGYND